ncbi:MAG: DUF6934 family protein [Emticicia sp.]
MEFREIEIPNLYNLALVNVKKDGTFDNMSISDNGNMETIVSTVIKTIQVFLTFQPEAKMLFMSSSPSRTRRNYFTLFMAFLIG